MVARRLLRRLVGPLTLWDAKDTEAAWVDWDTVLTPALLDGLTSPAPCADVESRGMSEGGVGHQPTVSPRSYGSGGNAAEAE